MSDDVIETLTRQHRELEKLLGDIQKGGASSRSDFNRAADDLIAHVVAEERVFYPAVKAERTKDVLLESLEEHLSLKRLVADLIRLDIADKTFEPKFKVLQEQVEHHHKEEEEHLFPKVAKMFDADRRARLGREFQTARGSVLAGDGRKMVLGETEAAARLK